MVTGAGIPETVQTMANLYFWKQDREVPDQWHVFFDYPQKEIAMVFNCTFASRHSGELIQFLGREKTLEVAGDICRTFDGEWKDEYLEKKRPYERRQAQQIGMAPQDAPRIPDYSMKQGEMQLTDHMRDFVDCVRSGGRPRCHVDRAFEEGVVIAMAMESFRRQRKVRWDSVREEIENV
jgi:predicted dehydrogenase